LAAPGGLIYSDGPENDMPHRGAPFWIGIAVTVAVYGLLNYYVLRRGWKALSGTGALRAVLLGFMLAGAVSVVAGRFLENRLPSFFADAVTVFGYEYLIFILYLFLLTVLVDLVRLADAFFRFFPDSLRSARTGGRMAFALVFGSVLLVLTAGTLQALRLRTRTIPLPLTKAAGALKSLRAVQFSDVHVSPVMPASRLARIIDRVNALNPDIVFITGDLASDDTSTRQLLLMSEVLKRLHPPLGVFACTGNHEYYGGLEKTCAAIRAGGVRILEDESVLVADSFYVAGRRDPTAAPRGGRRTPLSEILAGLDRSRPVILLDHQPIHLEEAAAAGIDLQLSGHTHNGQVFPINVINKGIYELNWGLLKKGPAWIYVTSGAGTWGPPVRLGSVSEIVLFEISFGR
jgi:predicted MPP superfamily phosphohydrolase